MTSSLVDNDYQLTTELLTHDSDSLFSNRNRQSILVNHLDHSKLLRTKRQISYRFPTGGRLHTAPRPSSYPLQWPPTPPTPSPLLRPPPSAPPPSLSQSANRQPTFLPRLQPTVSTERPQLLTFTPSSPTRPITATSSNSKLPDVSGNSFEEASRQVADIRARDQQPVTEFNRGNAFNKWVNPIRIQIPIPNTNAAAPGKVILTSTHESSLPIPNRNTADSGKLILTSAVEPSNPVTIGNAAKFILTSSVQSSSPLPNAGVGNFVLTSSSQPSNQVQNSNSGSTKLFHTSTGQSSISQQHLFVDAGKFIPSSAGHSSIPIPNTNTSEVKLIVTSSGRPSIPNTNGRPEIANEQLTAVRPPFSQSIIQRPQKGIDAEEDERQPNPFYGEHRFGPLLHDEREDVSFDFDSFLDELKEATSDEGLEPPFEDDLSIKSPYQEEALIKPSQEKDSEEETTENSKNDSKGRKEELGKVIKGHYILRENFTRSEPTLAVVGRPQREEGELLETSITLPKSTTMPPHIPTTPKTTPLRPTQRTRLRITTTTTNDFLDFKDDASVNNASYKAEPGRHRRPQQR
ncbi:hypothetical protein J437_LFUL016738 [Ladona fulva]|uniref:Uncharacterized protein n=1 Tax=Ladona fulva TaxID=123851 RepID=A0A8K0P7M6_LADFU|nr:hypothetical protein J437_LFUL016738 [Ladona fulva]